MARNDAAANVQGKKPIGKDQVTDESQRANLCFLYNNVERNLSTALQQKYLPDMIRYTLEARDNLRIAMRKMGWQGQF